jgi:hypothetical protein
MPKADENLPKKPTRVDWDAIEAAYRQIMGDKAEMPRGVEADITRMFVSASSVGVGEDRIPMSVLDTVVCEMAFKFGRADIVVFHIDGSASVIEVKDGTRGYNHVVSGIGQAGLYAAQLAMSKGALTLVRKCLLWTSAGNVVADSLIEEACEQSNTVALPWGLLSKHMAYERAVILAATNGG